MFDVLEEAGFTKVKSVIVPGFGFREGITRNAAESYGVKGVLFTAAKPG